MFESFKMEDEEVEGVEAETDEDEEEDEVEKTPGVEGEETI